MWIIFLFVLICSARHVYTDKLVTVQTTYGSVQGYETDSYRVFYGIPYAKAPIGALRWNKPEPIDKWAPSTFDATKIPPACPQPACNPGDILCPSSLGCLLGDISCLRTRPYENIITAQNVINSKITSLDILQFFEPWVPVIDNVIVRGQLIDMYSSASFPLKPLITGTMTEEGLAYVHGVLNTPLSYPAYLLVGPILFGAKFPAILLRFPQSPFTADMRPFLVKIVTQWVFACPTRFLARNTAAYSYVFGYPLRTMGLTNAGDCEAHACHGYELPFLFQAFWSYFDNNDQYISKTMATYWTNFAKSGNPNNPVKVPLTWPKLTSKSD
ncbi:unnamed protein product, partial [Rotaria sordida]